jgi:hypothetical protein
MGSNRERANFALEKHEKVVTYGDAPSVLLWYSLYIYNAKGIQKLRKIC